MSALIRRWRYVPRRSVHLPHPTPPQACDPWLSGQDTEIMPAIGGHW